jgi:hypothetical protein
MTTDRKIIPFKPQPHKTTHTATDTLLVTNAIIQSWKAPPFQRPLRINDKVRALAGEIKQSDGVIPGVITLGKLGRDTYLLDGQHRCHAFLMAELAEGYADVRLHQFSDVGEMGEEFVRLNSRLVNLRPDDILRGLEESTPQIRLIRQRCAFVAYDQVRRNEKSAVLSMSALLRCWAHAERETPTSSSGSAATMATQITVDQADELIGALLIFDRAWGRDPEYWKLWSNLNLTLCLWLYKRTVVAPYTPATTRITKEQFYKCMTAMSAASGYLDWLVGRNLSDRDRSPAYMRIKAVVAKRYHEETGRKPRLPQPPWSASVGRHR